MIPRPTAYRDGTLALSGFPLDEAAEQFGTPLFLYSAEAIRDAYRAVADAFAETDALIAYSVKANTNGAVLRLLLREGAAFDIVSGGELQRCLRAGAPGARLIFAGVGKTRDEMRQALEAGVLEFNVESIPEAEALDAVAAAAGAKAPVALRVNPDVAAGGHEYIATGRKQDKFGLPFDAAMALAKRIASGELGHLELVGVHAHIGSQIMDGEAHTRAAAVLEPFIAALRAEASAPLRTLNFGGGFGVDYASDSATDIRGIAEPIVALGKRTGLKLILEPGRSLVARAGVLLARVLYTKRGGGKAFAIVDASMTENIRPALYGARHEVLPVAQPAEDAEAEVVDVVGPVCESGDFLAKDRVLPRLEQDGLVALLDCGAYCAVMSTNYNSRPRAAEAIVEGGQAYLIRRRQGIQDLFHDEVVPGFLVRGSIDSVPIRKMLR